MLVYIFISFLVSVLNDTKWWLFLYGSIVLLFCLLVCLIGAGMLINMMIIIIIIIIIIIMAYTGLDGKCGVQSEECRVIGVC